MQPDWDGHRKAETIALAQAQALVAIAKALEKIAEEAQR
jgi:hypothetical protein